MTGGPVAGAHRSRRRRGLRFRFLIAFTAATGLLAAAVAGGAYLLCRQYLVDQRERALTNQAWSDARLMEQLVASEGAPDALRDYDVAYRSQVFVRANGRWLSGGTGIRSAELSASVRAAVAAGAVARQRVRIDGRPRLIVGVPLASARAQFFEVYSLEVLDETLHDLGLLLIAGVAMVTVIGGALAYWLAGRALAPLAATATTAEEVATGDLDARLVEYDDPGLARLSAAFNGMVTRLQARIELEHRFAADVGHELRGPLTRLSAAAEQLGRDRERLSPSVRLHLDDLGADLEHFRRLVLDLLEIHRSQVELEESSDEPVVLAELVARTVERVGDAPVPIVVDPELEGPVLVDKRRLARVVENLVTNARLHAGGLLQVRIFGVGDGDRVRLSFSDAGPGVDDAERTRIFEPFHRGSAADSRSGSGLGLALVREHVRSLGGSVWVESGPDGPGATFVVEIPRRPV